MNIGLEFVRGKVMVLNGRQPQRPQHSASGFHFANAFGRLSRMRAVRDVVRNGATRT